MASSLRTDEAVEYIEQNSDLNFYEARELFDEMLERPESFKFNDVQDIIDYLHPGRGQDEDIDNEEQEENEDMEFPDLEEFLSQDVGRPRSFHIGCDYKGYLSVKEFENERVYIPSSDYCYVKCFNKYIELMNRPKRLEFKHFYPYQMSLKKINLVISGLLIKCKNDCKVRDEKAYPGKSCSKECVRQRLEKFQNVGFPDVYKVWYDREKGKVIKKILSNDAPVCRDGFGIGICHIKGDEYHAILIKDPQNTTLTKEDITFQFVNKRDLVCDFVRNKRPHMPNPKHDLCVAYDIETYTEDVKYQSKRYRSTEKIRKKLVPYALGYQIIDLKLKEVISDYKEIKINNKEDNLFDLFFDALQQDPLVQDDTQIFAHNGGRFDNIYAKRAKNVCYEKVISKGSFIKQLVLYPLVEITKAELKERKNERMISNARINGKDIDNLKLYKINELDKTELVEIKGKKLKLKDTYPFTLMPLKIACKTFRTEISKIDFDIKDKSFEWYQERMMSYDDELSVNAHKKLNNKIKELEDHNKPILLQMAILDKAGDKESALFLSKALKKINQDQIKKEILLEEELYAVNNNWRIYLQADVQSLSQIIIKIEEAYNKYATSILWYTGLAGIAYHIVNNYCFGMRNFYVPKDPSMVSLIKESMYGGRVIQWKRFYKQDKSDKYDEGMISIDMNSLYPSAMMIGAYPYGNPKAFDQETIKRYNEYPHYIVEAKIKIPNIRYAYHPYKTDDGLLVYPSNQIITGVYNDVDLREMIKDGYEVLEVKLGIYWVQSNRIFTNFIQQLYDERNRYKKLGEDHPEYPMEYIIKIILNSCYGKFNETIRAKTLFKNKDYEHFKTNEGKVDSTFVLPNGQKEVNISLFRHVVSKPTYIGGYVLAYSRAMVNEIIRTIGTDNIYYSDTDSLYVEKRILKEKNLQCSSVLGGFKNDYGDDTAITEAIFLDMKRYFLELDDLKKGTHFYKAKFNGLSFKSINSIKSFKIEDIDYNKLSDVDKLNTTKEIYLKFLEQHKKRLQCPYQILDRNMDKEQKKIITQKQKEWEKEYIKELQILTEFWNKQKDTVLIEEKELIYQIDPHRRGNWIGNEYYALGYDMTREEEEKLHNGKVGDLQKECEEQKLVSYTINYKHNLTYLQMNSYRPLVMRKGEKLGSTTDSGILFHSNRHEINKISTTILYAITKTDRGFIEDVIYFNPSDDENKMYYLAGEGTYYQINAFGKFNPQKTNGRIEECFYRIYPLIAMEETDENLRKYGANYISKKDMKELLQKISRHVPFNHGMPKKKIN